MAQPLLCQELSSPSCIFVEFSDKDELFFTPVGMAELILPWEMEQVSIWVYASW